MITPIVPTTTDGAHLPFATLPQTEVGLTVAGQFARAPVFAVTLWLHPPDDNAAAVSWELPLVARRNWRLPFAVLLGQRGWFDRFPTLIDGTTCTVMVPG